MGRAASRGRLAGCCLPQTLLSGTLFLPPSLADVFPTATAAWPARVMWHMCVTSRALCSSLHSRWHKESVPYSLTCQCECQPPGPPQLLVLPPSPATQGPARENSLRPRQQTDSPQLHKREDLCKHLDNSKMKRKTETQSSPAPFFKPEMPLKRSQLRVSEL